MIDLDSSFCKFCESLKQRTGFLSEDNIRFYWFVSMLEQDKDLNHYSLEEPYGEEMKGKELDLMYETAEERLCIEIKFHRNGEKQSTFAHTMSAGEIFDDLQRLPQWNKKRVKDKPTRYLFLYVTDEEMNKYLTWKEDGERSNRYRYTLRNLYVADKGRIPVCEFHSEESNGDTPKTFLEHACGSYNKEGRNYLRMENILLLHKADDIVVNSKSVMKGKCNIRLYEVFQC